MPRKRRFPVKTLISLFLVLVLVPATILLGVFVLHDRAYYFVSLLLIVYTMVPFFLLFEKRKPQARELVVIAVLCAIAVAGRAAFFMLPQVKPMMAVVILAGVALGPQAGFLTGAVSAFVSNFFFGQGPWTPWQMFCFGIVGFLAGLLFREGRLKPGRISLCVFGGLCTLVIYGGIMNPASVLLGSAKLTWGAVLTSYLTGLPMDLIHAASTVVFLLVLSKPMLEKLSRIQIKYGLLRDS